MKTEGKPEKVGNSNKTQKGGSTEVSKQKVTPSLGGLARLAFLTHFPAPPRLLRAPASTPKVQSLSEKLTPYLPLVGNIYFIACIAYDAYRVASAFVRDIKRRGRPGKVAAKTTTSIGSSWIMSSVGVHYGTVLGAWLGGSIGSMLAGVGAIPGTGVGSVVGGLLGGVAGTYSGSFAGEAVVDILVTDDEPEEEEAKKDE